MTSRADPFATHFAPIRPRTKALDMQAITCILVSMEDRFDKVFKALADSTRRHLLDRLHAQNGQTLGTLCESLEMSRQAVTQHLAVLEAANLVVAIREGREKLHYLNPVPIHEIADRWIGKYERSRLRAVADLKMKLEGRKD